MKAVYVLRAVESRDVCPMPELVGDSGGTGEWDGLSTGGRHLRRSTSVTLKAGGGAGGGSSCDAVYIIGVSGCNLLLGFESGMGPDHSDFGPDSYNSSTVRVHEFLFYYFFAMACFGPQVIWGTKAFLFGVYENVSLQWHISASRDMGCKGFCSHAKRGGKW